MMLRIGCLIFAFCVAGIGASAQDYEISLQVRGLDTPWAMEVLPDGSLLVTEIDGRLLRFANGERTEVAGPPKVAETGQGGLLDVTLARDFAVSRTLFLTYAKPMPGGAGTALAAAELSGDNRSLDNLRDLFVMSQGSRKGQHFGSRVVEGLDGTLFVTIGDRGNRPAAQDLGQHNGKVVRVNPDGTIPSDNPFVGQEGTLPEIWSYGHRNPQGAGLDAQGNLWVSEHGARGGDEINLVRKGANFGWPVVAFGRHYSGLPIGEGTAKPGMEQPMHYWDPSIAPSGLLVYTGQMFPKWRDSIFVGSLKFDYIALLGGVPLAEAAQINTGQTARVRDIVQGPDGSIWFISVGNGAIYKIAVR